MIFVARRINERSISKIRWLLLFPNKVIMEYGDSSLSNHKISGNDGIQTEVFISSEKLQFQSRSTEKRAENRTIGDLSRRQEKAALPLWSSRTQLRLRSFP